MRKELLLAALAGLIGTAACSASASEYGYRERWYKSYERYREAADRRRENAEERAYRWYMRNQLYDTYGDCDYCSYYPSYRSRHYHHGYRTRYYDYDYDYGYSYRHYDHYGYGPRLRAPYYTREAFEPSGREWRPEDQPIGGGQWWQRLDNEGRGGQR